MIFEQYQMKFKIICQNNLSSNGIKEVSKEPETRPNSANKTNYAQSFRQMVRNSYEYYKTLPKDELIKESLQYVEIKQEKQKKAKIEEEKRIRAEIRLEEKEKQILRERRREKRFQTMKRKIQKEKLQPIRKSQRKKNPETIYVEEQRKKSLADLSIQDIEKDQVLLQKIIKKPAKKNNEETSLLTNKQKQKFNNNHIEDMNQKKLQFKEVGTYPLGLLHENILKIQEAIDTHLTFRKEMRKMNSISVQQLVKYVRNQGFILLNESNFYILTQINPNLYKLTQDTEDGHMIVWVFSYRLQDIAKRKEETRQKMSQICLQEIIT